MFDRPMTWRRAAWAVAFGLILTVSAPAPSHAQEDAAQVPPEILKLEDRLALTEEQKLKTRPIFDESAQQRRDVMEKNGVTPGSFDQLGRGQRSSMGRAMRDIRKETEKKLAKILTAEQLQEYRKVQEEARERRREQLDRGER